MLRLACLGVCAAWRRAALVSHRLGLREGKTELCGEPEEGAICLPFLDRVGIY